MNGIWYYIIAFFLIWILSLTFRRQLSNHGFEINFPTIMWKTKRFHNVIEKIANFSPRFWKWFMNVGIIISFIAMFFITYSLIQSLSTLIEAPAVSIVLPGVEMPGSTIYVPLGYGLISLATVLIVHEFSHGILSRVEKINIKSVGLLLFTILPGAFVEPDEEELVKSSKLSQLRVYAAGSMANITLAIVALLIFSAVGTYGIPNTFDENGIEIDRVVSDSPANGVLKEGMILESINNHTIKDSDDYMEIVETFVPGERVSIGTDQGIYNITLSENPSNSSRGFVGVQAANHFEIKESVSSVFGDTIPWILFEISTLTQWIFILNLGVGLFNLLPVKPLDGGRMFEIVLSYKLKEETYKPITNAISIVLATIIIFSLIYGFIG
ncbi:MAG: site-2 protease family protein [Methanobrevibacter woesei]|uniref:site-2 protease family protein n=1 Tax=Methanobrevibacter woesei TaxID=190976 RepID=UPI0023F472BD|nr:site-2 protease family protein [Methanobrevibacter woesei]MCI7291091.1 site-2 protease family protein [Methanobrevibacter woesei]